jgi:hypothetical protein
VCGYSLPPDVRRTWIPYSCRRRLRTQHWLIYARPGHKHVRSSAFGGGGNVTIDDDAELLTMIDLVHEHNKLVLCQLHTHPADAFHSWADDHGAFTDEIGFLSLVLPSFGTGGLETAVAYRRTRAGWEHEGFAVESGLVEVFSDVLSYGGGGWSGN